LNGNTPLLLLIYVFGIFLIFKYTSIAVDEYVADGISKISDWLGMSESLAAVTLLAFANGAGDVITALVAGDTEGGVSYNIGALYGAGLFVCSMVVSICIF
jgi:sodium/potassium/calcium exchanger 6